MEEVSFQVDQTRGMEEKVTREFLKTEVVEEEAEDVAGLAVVVFHLEFAANVHQQHKRVVLIFVFALFFWWV